MEVASVRGAFLLARFKMILKTRNKCRAGGRASRSSPRDATKSGVGSSTRRLLNIERPLFSCYVPAELGFVYGPFERWAGLGHLYAWSLST